MRCCDTVKKTLDHSNAWTSIVLKHFTMCFQTCLLKAMFQTSFWEAPIIFQYAVKALWKLAALAISKKTQGWVRSIFLSQRIANYIRDMFKCTLAVATIMASHTRETYSTNLPTRCMRHISKQNKNSKWVVKWKWRALLDCFPRIDLESLHSPTSKEKCITCGIITPATRFEILLARRAGHTESIIVWKCAWFDVVDAFLCLITKSRRNLRRRRACSSRLGNNIETMFVKRPSSFHTLLDAASWQKFA